MKKNCGSQKGDSALEKRCSESTFYNKKFKQPKQHK